MFHRPDFYLRLNTDPFALELRASPSPRRHSADASPLARYYTHSSEYTHHAVSSTRHGTSYRHAYHPRTPPLPHALTDVTAHIHTPFRSPRTRLLTVCAREKIKAVVRQLLGPDADEQHAVFVRKRGTWWSVGMEARVGEFGAELELRIEEEGGRVERREWERERVVVERVL